MKTPLKLEYLKIKYLFSVNFNFVCIKHLCNIIKCLSFCCENTKKN